MNLCTEVGSYHDVAGNTVHYPSGRNSSHLSCPGTLCMAASVVADNGVGMPDTIDFKTTEALGLRLVTILAEGQLGGHIELVKGPGTEFHIRFKE